MSKNDKSKRKNSNGRNSNGEKGLLDYVNGLVKRGVKKNEKRLSLSSCVSPTEGTRKISRASGDANAISLRNTHAMHEETSVHTSIVDAPQRQDYAQNSAQHDGRSSASPSKRASNPVNSIESNASPLPSIIYKRTSARYTVLDLLSKQTNSVVKPPHLSNIQEGQCVIRPSSQETRSTVPSPVAHQKRRQTEGSLNFDEGALVMMSMGFDLNEEEAPSKTRQSGMESSTRKRSSKVTSFKEDVRGSQYPIFIPHISVLALKNLTEDNSSPPQGATSSVMSPDSSTPLVQAPYETTSDWNDISPKALSSRHMMPEASAICLPSRNGANANYTHPNSNESGSGLSFSAWHEQKLLQARKAGGALKGTFYTDVRRAKGENPSVSFFGNSDGAESEYTNSEGNGCRYSADGEANEHKPSTNSPTHTASSFSMFTWSNRQPFGGNESPQASYSAEEKEEEEEREGEGEENASAGVDSESDESNEPSGDQGSGAGTSSSSEVSELNNSSSSSSSVEEDGEEGIESNACFMRESSSAALLNILRAEALADRQWRLSENREETEITAQPTRWRGNQGDVRSRYGSPNTNHNAPQGSHFCPPHIQQLMWQKQRQKQKQQQYLQQQQQIFSEYQSEMRGQHRTNMASKGSVQLDQAALWPQSTPWHRRNAPFKRAISPDWRRLEANDLMREPRPTVPLIVVQDGFSPPWSPQALQQR